MSIDGYRYQQLFQRIMRKRHNMTVDFETIERGIDHVQKGAPLTYPDLELIADEKYWPFKEYWMWPSEEQIGARLTSTRGLLSNLFPNEVREINAIKQLSAIFKNIELVSIVLRFVWPEYYAIYSPPPLMILRVERGVNYIQEYRHYLGVVRLLKLSFGVERAADVDTIVWSVAHAREEQDEFIQVLAATLPERLSPRNLIKYLSKNPLRISQAYFRNGEYKTAGFWGARAFEDFLYKECFRIYGLVPPKENQRQGDLEHLCDCVCHDKKNARFTEVIRDLRGLRNRVVHKTNLFEENDADRFIAKLKLVMGKN